MEIVTYEEVDDVQMAELTLACFDHTYSKEHVEDMIEADGRVPEWGGEMYAVEGEKVLGTLGILYPRIKTKDGIETVGGIRNVCTRPSASREGVAKKLMEEAHRRMEERGVRFSFLITSRSLVAYALYRKLGYRDVYRYPIAFKKGEKVDTDVYFKDEVDKDYLRSTYQKSVEGLRGLIVREDDYWEMAETRGWPDNSDVKTAYDGDERIGYAMFKRNRGQIKCSEMAAESEAELHRLIWALEEKADGSDVVYSFVNPNYRKALEENGYHHYDDRWSRIMVKGWDKKLQLDEESFHNGIYESF